MENENSSKTIIPSRTKIAEVPVFYPQFEKAHFVIIGGLARGGKGVLMQDIVSKVTETHPEFRFWGKIMILCPTANLQDSYREMFPQEWTMTQFDIDTVIRELLDSQEQLADHERQRVLLIIDDVIGVCTSKLLQRLAVSGRWYKIDTIILAQHLKGLINPCIRSNASYILCTKVSGSSRQVIIDEIPRNIFPTTNKAKQFVDANMQIPYQFIGLSNNPEEPPVFTMKVNMDEFNPISFRLE